MIPLPLGVGFFIGEALGLSLDGRLIPMAIVFVIWLPVLGKQIGTQQNGRAITVAHAICKLLTGLSYVEIDSLYSDSGHP